MTVASNHAAVHCLSPPTFENSMGYYYFMPFVSSPWQWKLKLRQDMCAVQCQAPLTVTQVSNAVQCTVHCIAV